MRDRTMATERMNSRTQMISRTRASEQGLTYTPDQCHRLIKANFERKVNANAINVQNSNSFQ